jgi:hypothetical protein
MKPHAPQGKEKQVLGLRIEVVVPENVRLGPH